MEKKKKTNEEWDAEFEADMEKKGLDEKIKADMRLMRKFAIGLLEEEEWALKAFEKLKKKMPIPFQIDSGDFPLRCEVCPDHPELEPLDGVGPQKFTCPACGMLYDFQPKK